MQFSPRTQCRYLYNNITIPYPHLQAGRGWRKHFWRSLPQLYEWCWLVLIFFFFEHGSDYQLVRYVRVFFKIFLKIWMDITIWSYYTLNILLEPGDSWVSLLIFFGESQSPLKFQAQKGSPGEWSGFWMACHQSLRSCSADYEGGETQSVGRSEGVGLHSKGETMFM